MQFDVPLRQLVLESPDCGGKTSLFNEIHRQTQFRWNIHDRSHLSMLIYALQYGRDAECHRENLREELSNFSNKFVFSLLPVETHIERLRRRGDVMQDEESIKKQHEIFVNVIEDIKVLPNVYLIQNSTNSVADNAEFVIRWLNNTSKLSISDIAYYVGEMGMYSSTLSGYTDSETSVNFTFEDVQPLILNHDLSIKSDETVYYSNIRSKFISKIASEISYNMTLHENASKVASRRFIFSDSECISCIHMLHRNNVAHVNVYMRSSLIEKLESDIGAVRNIIADTLGKFSMFQSTKKAVFNFKIGSLHIKS